MDVTKIYDRNYAHEVFLNMDDRALKDLAAALEIDSNYDSADLPDPNEPEYAAFVWEELLKAAIEDVRLDPRLQSFFLVSRTAYGRTEDLYVSADWPSAEAFAKQLMSERRC